MPLKKTILVTLLLVLLLSIPLILLLPSDEPVEEPIPDEPAEVQILFDQNHAEHIQRLRFTASGKEEISVSRTAAGGWQITDRPGLPVDPKVMTALLRQYEQMLALRRITESMSDPAEYGLDTPALKLTLSGHGADKTYLFGDKNDYYEGYYCTQEGSDTVYLLDYAYFTALNLTVEDLLKQETLPDLSSLTRLEWTTASGAPLAETGVLQAALATLKIDRMVDYGAEQYATYKLDRAADGKITLQDGKTLTLRLSVGETDELIYLTVDDRELIYLVTCQNKQALLDAIGKP